MSTVAEPRITWPSAHSPSSAVVFAQNTIEIKAPAKKVWSLLIDCVQWPSWYKHCSDVSVLSGGPVLSTNSKFRFKTLDLYFEPEVEIYEEPRMLVWSAKGPGGTSGAHAWYIEPTPNGCRVVTEEAQKGLLLFLVRTRTRDRLLTSHQEWLKALKQLAEES